MSDKIIAWLLQKVAESSPPSTPLETGSVGAKIASLAELAAALRRANGSAMLFGMQTAADVVARARTEVLPAVNTALSEWRARLTSEHGAEGTEAFTTIVARYHTGDSADDDI